ncbi:hypothetical protein [Hymenobacter cellulosivorans]|uniref:Uncharacterized protein n=1 Tax=Hymenobacter cellulosivorans TaxID=2932249 RepID=A0ABY4F6M4_9BACT|nr:hypothetical protein [Hymenobacter cellulosivorans]UOQ51678.1 hypothetical protein MUN80_18165 [Hymenobacter cellulosivorans]
MPDSPIPDNQMVTVMVAETTFAVLTMPGRKFRVDFVEKAEARLKPGMRGESMSCSEHPLLLSLNSRLVDVYITSRPQNPRQLLAEIRKRIQLVFQEWRDWRCVLFGRGAFGESHLRRNLLDGSGLLLSGAPLSVAQAVMNACTEHGVSAYFLGEIENSPLASPTFHLLLVGDKGYVIAQDFRFVEL